MQQNINQSETGIGDKKLSVELYVLYPLKTREILCFSGVFRSYEMGILPSNGLKRFGRVGHIDLPHKHKFYDIYWKLFYHILSFLNDKGLLIHLDRNLSFEWVFKFWTNSLPFEHRDLFDNILLMILVSTQNVTKHLAGPLSRN